MAPGSVPTGSGRAGSFSSSEILEQVALALAAAAGLAFGLVLSWVFGACGGGWTLSVPFRFANERARYGTYGWYVSYWLYCTESMYVAVAVAVARGEAQVPDQPRMIVRACRIGSERPGAKAQDTVPRPRLGGRDK